MARENAWKKYDEQALCALEEISKKYRGFLNDGKTERECVSQTVALAEKAGYIDLKDAIAKKTRLVPGDKVYVNCMGKAIMLFHMGKRPLEAGL